MPSVIELLDLTVCLGGRVVLDGLKGSTHARSLGLLGPNGSGKSTLINTLLGFHRPAAGSARVLGFNPATQSRALRAILGYMPEDDAFIANMTGVHFVRFMAELSGVPPRPALERAHEMLVYVGLGEARYRRLGTYSIGMKQQVKLAQALVHGPELLILDEPTNGLDPAARQRMLRLIREVLDAGRTHVVISSHLLYDVEALCDEVILLKQGRMVAQVDLEQERRRGDSVLELEIANGNNDFALALSARGGECVIAPGTDGAMRLRLVWPPELGVRTLYELAEHHRVLIRRLDHRRNCLEELFLEVMRGSRYLHSAVGGDTRDAMVSDTEHGEVPGRRRTDSGAPNVRA